ncbi:MAG: hypothetical protein MK086_12015 [Flavobacteriales bacterium]|nr:hypothetical protein [Flavobacteriales bacterium]
MGGAVDLTFFLWENEVVIPTPASGHLVIPNLSPIEELLKFNMAQIVFISIIPNRNIMIVFPLFLDKKWSKNQGRRKAIFALPKSRKWIN